MGTSLDMIEALAQRVREQRSALAGLARREGLGAEDAVDCVHDALCAFLELGVRGGLPKDPAEHAAFLAGMVVNGARNQRRLHRVAKPHEPLDVAQRPDDAPGLDTLLGHAEDCVRLRACVNRLCANQRNVVMMRLLEERPGEDVAAALGLTRGYVDVLLYRARAALASCMAEEG